MKNFATIQKSITELNFTKLEREIEERGGSSELIAEVLKAVKQTGCLLIQHENRPREEKRDQFVAALGRWLLTINATQECHSLIVHAGQALLCQRAFRDILDVLARSPAGQASPPVAVWSTLSATAADMTDLLRTASEHKPAMVIPGLAFVSSEAIRLDVHGRSDLDPDGAMERYAINLGGYLKMLGHRHGWFKDGVLRIPTVTAVPDALKDDRSALYLAELWNQLDTHWDRLRHLNTSSARLTKRVHETPKGTREVDTLVFDHDWDALLDLEIARTRLRSRVFGVGMAVLTSELVNARIGDLVAGSVPLGPEGYISHLEVVSLLVLDMCYGLSLKSDQTQYFGLTLSEWLRGYALLQFCAREQMAVRPVGIEGVVSLDVGAFLDLGLRAGMKKDRLERFMKHVTFHRNSRDLFDTPLIRTTDDQYLMLPALVAHMALPEALNSRVNSLLVQFDKKGSKFEEEVRETFRSMGATATGVKYNNAEGVFECDAAVLWGDDLFLVECKAYTLPASSASSEAFFRLKQRDAVDQITRIARHISEDPSILSKAFGHVPKISRVTCCVINLAPFSLPGKGTTVKVYDHGALSKFSAGTVDAVVFDPKHATKVRTVMTKLWAGEVPVPDDLLVQMDEPLQWLTEAEKWERAEHAVGVSEDLVVMLPFLRRRADEPPVIA